jgi:hypothetical protein
VSGPKQAKEPYKAEKKKAELFPEKKMRTRRDTSSMLHVLSP